MNRYILFYAPPNRMGVYTGVLVVVITFFFMPVMVGVSAWIEAGEEDTRDRFYTPLFWNAAAGLVFLLLFNGRLMLQGFPESPRLLAEDETEMAMMFACRTLDEVAQVTGITKQEVLRELANPDPAHIKTLFARVDPEKVGAILDNQDEDAFIDMLEQAPNAEEEEHMLMLDEPEYVPVKQEDSELFATPLLEIKPVPDAAGTAPAAPAEAAPAAPAAPAPAVPTSGPLTPEQVRALGKRLGAMIDAADSAGIRQFLLQEPIDNQWLAFVDMEEWMTQQESDAQEKAFNRLIPPKQFAKLLRERKELRGLVTKLMKRELKKNLKKVTGRRK
mmetsp:Transcript_29662/g.67216  ORF Transcript_29662/g.67216 Transcript_29662/m.67216 type:complete len:331 (-) Transcript_29662:230-1222(-)